MNHSTTDPATKLEPPNCKIASELRAQLFVYCGSVFWGDPALCLQGAAKEKESVGNSGVLTLCT